MQDLITIKDASIWASQLLGKDVTPSNISYLVQYGRIQKAAGNGALLVSKLDLENYYHTHHQSKEALWKEKLGGDLNWNLSFEKCKESETTKHVHRIHPYKGKFIPQLAEYFLDRHTDDFKRAAFFNAGDIVLDPFCGSGTALVQASELNLHAVGVDVSSFNAFISNSKVDRYDVSIAGNLAGGITQKLFAFQKEKNNAEFEARLLDELKAFNARFFPSPDYQYRVRNKQIDEKSYAKQKSEEFLKTYNALVKEYGIPLQQGGGGSFLDKWFLQTVRDEIDFVFNKIKSIEDQPAKKLLALILSRTVRSCRATTHADLGTLKTPVTAAYYCKKHGKVCKPVFSILGWWQRYAMDTIKRVRQFERLRSDTFQRCLAGDSRRIDIVRELGGKNAAFGKLIARHKIDGIFSSPPYVGLIDYHEQHAYAYDLFGFGRNDALEIGPLCKGQGVAAQKSYVAGVSDVLRNCKKFLKKDCNVFLVANDKYRLYPQIAELAEMKIVNEYKRPVLNRMEKDKSAYAEIIFHMRRK
ncbi:MAG: site-specific DNA-methyltransferase [Gammaproteobacteria bacterium]